MNDSGVVPANIGSVVCSTCNCTDKPHNCISVLLGRARLLIVHYGHGFAEPDKADALQLIDQIELVINEVQTTSS